MADQPAPDRFKAEMPDIPGVTAPAARRTGLASPTARLAGGLLLALLLVFVIARLVMRPKHSESAQGEPTPQIVVPAPASEAPPALPESTETQPGIATVADLAKPWDAKEFFFRNRLTAENIPSLIIRLPGGSASQPSGYWALSMKAQFGSCQLEYITDLDKLANDYGFKAKHPMVGNPCSRTVFDPLNMMNLPGNVWVRGRIAQGSDIRPPLGIELEMRGKDILATRME